MGSPNCAWHASFIGKGRVGARKEHKAGFQRCPAANECQPQIQTAKSVKALGREEQRRSLPFPSDRPEAPFLEVCLETSWQMECVALRRPPFFQRAGNRPLCKSDGLLETSFGRFRAGCLPPLLIPRGQGVSPSVRGRDAPRPFMEGSCSHEHVAPSSAAIAVSLLPHSLACATYTKYQLTARTSTAHTHCCTTEPAYCTATTAPGGATLA